MKRGGESDEERRGVQPMWSKGVKREDYSLFTAKAIVRMTKDNLDV